MALLKGKAQDVSVKHYNLDVIISVGYRVKSQQATQFRIWTTQRLKDYIIKGFALNDERFKSDSSMNYFSELQERIRKIRISERFFYQKIKDNYKTSINYDADDEKTILFFNGGTKQVTLGNQPANSSRIDLPACGCFLALAWNAIIRHV